MEFSPRPPHTRRFVQDDKWTEFHVDGMGLVSVSEEAFANLLKELGWREGETIKAVGRWDE